MTVVLWHIELSHYSEKVRWALDYKDIPHERRVPMPGLHGIRAAVLTRGAQRRLPVIDLDGRRIWDSTGSSRRSRSTAPSRRSTRTTRMSSPRRSRTRSGSTSISGPDLRRLVWFHTLPDTDATAAALFTNESPARERLLRMTASVSRRAVSADYEVNAATAAAARGTLFEAMDRIENAIGPSGYLVGDRFSVADLTGAALFTPLLAPPERPYAPDLLPAAIEELREELMARPGGDWVFDMYARHRTAWVPA